MYFVTDYVFDLGLAGIDDTQLLPLGQAGPREILAMEVTDYADDSTTTATITIGGPAEEATLDTGTFGEFDQDWFAVTLAAGQTYRFTIQDADGDGSLLAIIDLVDETGDALAFGSIDPFGNLVVDYYANEAGVYYIDVFGNGGAYTLTGEAFADDLAGDITTSQSLVPGVSVDATIDFAGDSDFFRVDISAPQTITFNLDALGLTSLDGGSLTIDDDDLLTETIQTSGDSASFTYDFTEAGTYYVIFAMDGSANTGSYRLTTSTFENDFPADSSTDGIIVTGGPVISSTIDTANDVDWFAIDVTSGENVVLTLTDTTGTNALGALSLNFVTADGQILASSTLQSGETVLSYQTTDAGRFYVTTGASPDTTGSYTLSAAPSVGEDDFAGNATTTGILPLDGTTVSGSIDFEGDRDWFSFTVAEDSVVRVVFTDELPNIDISSFPPIVVAANGDIYGTTQSDDGDGFLLLPAGDYFLNVLLFQSANTGAYTITAEPVQQALTLDGPAVTDTLEDASDEAWFALATTNAGVAELTVDISGFTPPSATVVIFNDFGEIIFISELDGSNNTLFPTLPANQTVFVQVTSPFTDSTGNISVSIQSPNPLTPQIVSETGDFDLGLLPGYEFYDAFNGGIETARLSDGTVAVVIAYQTDDGSLTTGLTLFDTQGVLAFGPIALDDATTLTIEPTLDALPDGFLVTFIRANQDANSPLTELVSSRYNNEGTLLSTSTLFSSSSDNVGLTLGYEIDVAADGSFSASYLIETSQVGSAQSQFDVHIVDVSVDGTVLRDTIVETSSIVLLDTDILTLADGTQLILWVEATETVPLLHVERIDRATDGSVSTTALSVSSLPLITDGDAYALADGFAIVGADEGDFFGEARTSLSIYNNDGTVRVADMDVSALVPQGGRQDILQMADGSIIVSGVVDNGQTAIQRFDSNGNPVGNVVIIGDTGGVQSSTSLIALSDTQFLATYLEFNQFATELVFTSDVLTIDPDFTPPAETGPTTRTDQLIGTDEGETIDGLAGSDTIFGQGGADSLLGSDGDDTLYGDIAQAAGFDVNSVEGLVFRAYQAVLGRAPDLGGFNANVTNIRFGVQTQTDLISSFVASEEFSLTYGNLSDEAFVQQLYRNVLGREADAEGLAAFTAGLEDNLTREDVVIEFTNTPEFLGLVALPSAAFATQYIGYTPEEATVFRVYQAVFNRAPDAGGFIANVNALQGEALTIDQITASFVLSAEFQLTYGDLSIADFVEALYTNVLPGNTDQAGRDAFIGRLTNDSTYTRADMVTEFVNSPEFISRQTDAAAAFIATVYANEGDILNGGPGDDILFGGRGADTFVYNNDLGGNDIIVDFTIGTDILDLSESFTIDDFATLLDFGAQVGADTIFGFENGNTLTLLNVQLSALSETDINFEEDLAAAEFIDDVDGLI